MMSYLAIPGRVAACLREELLSTAPLESGTFCLLETVRLGDTVRHVLGRPLATAEPWIEQATERLTPSSRAISQAISAANEVGVGLAFVHTHPADDSAPVLSRIDQATTVRLGAAFAELLDGQFASVVLGPGGFGGALATDGRIEPFERIAVAGRHVETWGPRLAGPDAVLDDRQVRALGPLGQAQLRDLRVAVVGAGGLGSPTAETLVRMGAGRVTLVDFDILDTPSNARRVFGIGRSDVRRDGTHAKAEAVAAALQRLDLGGTVEAVVGDVRAPDVRRHLLDADLVINGTDTHSSRAALTELAVRAAIPIIDVGVRVGARNNGTLDALRLERRVLLPDGPCLWCWNRLSAEQVRTELLPDAERESLAAQGYVTGDAGAPVPSVAALTVAAAGAATSVMLGMVTGAFDVAPLASGLDALSLEPHPIGGDEPDPDCVCARWRRARLKV